MSDKSRRRMEATIQRACVKYLREQFPQVITYRHGAGDQLKGGKGVYRWRMLEGEVAGAGDLFILKPNAAGKHGLMVEFKTPGNGLEPKQREVRMAVLGEGYAHAVVHSLQEFVGALNNYFVPTLSWDEVCAAPDTAKDSEDSADGADSFDGFDDDE